MDDSAAAQHLALLARTGLMTHVALLDPPVTAEAVRHFREDAATQASNVMAVGAGRFALCLPPGRREIVSGVPHRLQPIAGADARAATGAVDVHETPPSAPPPVDCSPAPPPASSPPAPAARAVPAVATRPQAADGRAVLAALVEGQGAIAAGLDRLASEVAAARALQESAPPEMVARGRADAQPRTDAPAPDRTLAERLTGLAAETRSAQAATTAALHEVLAAIETLAGRVAALEVAPGSAPEAPPEFPRSPADAARPPAPSPRPPATVTPIHALSAAAPAPAHAAQAPRDLPEGLDGMLQAILARLAHLARADAPQTGAVPPDAPRPNAAPSGAGQHDPHHDPMPPWQRSGSQRP